MANKNDQLVVAYFPNRGAAEATAEGLKDWDKANDSIKLGAIAILALNPKNGKIEAEEIGERSTRSGALWGTAIGVTVGILTAGIGLIPGLLLGAGGGAAVGALNHKSVGMTDEDQEQIVNHLRDGLVALAVMADDFEVEATMAKMVSLGGRAFSYKMPEETATAVTTAARLQTEALAAVDSAVDTTTAAVDSAVSTTTETVDSVKKTITADLSHLSAAAAATVTGLVAGIDISAADAEKLQAAGVKKVSSFYKTAATPQGRTELANSTKLSADEILVMEKKLDLMRVKGVEPKNASLLLASGIDSVPELGTRNATNLLGKMTEVNAMQSIVDALPSEAEVTAWVAQAKTLPKVIVF